MGETPFLALPIEHHCQREIDNARKFDERRLFNLAFNILLLRSDVEDIPFDDSQFNLDAPNDTIVQLALTKAASDVHKISIITIETTVEEGHSELLRISRFRPRGRRRGHQSFLTEWRPTEFYSHLLGRTMDLDNLEDDKFNPIKLEPGQIMDLAKFLWASYLISPPESEFQA